MAIAASIAFALVVGWQVLPLDREPVASKALAALAGHAAGDHRDCALHPALEEPPISLEEAARRYSPIYAPLRDVIAQSGPVRDGTAEILGAHWCVFKGRSFCACGRAAARNPRPGRAVSVQRGVPGSLL